MTRRLQHYPPELRERAVRMVFEVTSHYDSQWAAINAVAQKLGCRDRGDGAQVGPPGRDRRRQRAGATSEESADLKRLRRENAELGRANEILKAASAFSRPSSTGPRHAREVHR
jgi:transposase